MALFTDGLPATLEDLRAFDSSVYETAKNEDIDLNVKLTVANEELALELALFLLRAEQASSLTLTNGAVDLDRVVATPAVRRWHALLTLASVYCDAYNSQLNDRYQGRWKHFSRLAREASELLWEVGVGVVWTPVPKAPAPDVVSAGGGAPVATYAFRIAWRTANGSPGAPGDTTLFSAGSGELPRVSAPVPPAPVSAFDVYAGLAGDDLTLQTSTPVAIGQSWTMPAEGIVQGVLPGDGQSPDFFVRRTRLIHRG